MVSKDIFESKQSPIDIKNFPVVWKGLNGLPYAPNILEELAYHCRERDFPELFLDPDPGKKNGSLQMADLFTTDLQISQLPEKQDVVRVWRDALWHNRNQLTFQQMTVDAGPPQALTVQDPANRVTTYDAKKLIEYVAEHGRQEDEREFRFPLDADPLYQIRAEFWAEPRRALNLIGARLCNLQVFLYRWDKLGSYSGQGHIGTIKIHNTRRGRIILTIQDLHEIGLASFHQAQPAVRLSPIKIYMPNGRNNQIQIRLPKEIAHVDESDLKGYFDEITYKRWIEDYRVQLSRAQILEPLINSLGIAMGVVE